MFYSYKALSAADRIKRLHMNISYTAMKTIAQWLKQILPNKIAQGLLDKQQGEGKQKNHVKIRELKNMVNRFKWTLNNKSRREEIERNRERSSETESLKFDSLMLMCRS